LDAGPKRFDRVARFRQMQAIWAGDAFLRSGAAGANGAGAISWHSLHCTRLALKFRHALSKALAQLGLTHTVLQMTNFASGWCETAMGR